MSMTIFKSLQTANDNIKSGDKIKMSLAIDDLNNAVVLLEKGYDLYDEIDPLLDEYGDVENVPDIS